MPARPDPLRTILKVAVYGVFCYVVLLLTAWTLWGLDLPLVTAVLSTFTAAVLGNLLGMRIYERLGLRDIGLTWNGASARNARLGVLRGAAAACLVLAPPLVVGAARFVPAPEGAPPAGNVVYVLLILAIGAAAEEMFIHGYGFQVLLKDWGRWIAIPSVAVVFAALHADNPSASWIGLANTAAFGALFGYAVCRSRDLWLPMGMHFGWNVTLPLFGVNVSGLKIGMTGHAIEWTAGRLWSGADYGPEGSLLTTGVVVILFAWLRRAPVRTQPSRLLDPPAEIVPCESAPPQ